MGKMMLEMNSPRLAVQPHEFDPEISFLLWQFTRDARFLPKLLDHLSSFHQSWQREICRDSAAVLRGEKKDHLRSADTRLKAIGIALAVDNDCPEDLSISDFLATLEISNGHGGLLGERQLWEMMLEGRRMIEETQKTIRTIEK